MVKNLPAMGETWVLSLVLEIPWRMEQQASPIFLPEKSHGQKILVGYRPWGPQKSEPFSKHSTLAIRALTHESEEHTLSPQYYLTKALLGGIREKEAC